MKKYTCLTVLLAMVSLQYAQAAEVPFVDLEGHTRYIIHATFSPDSKTVVTSGWADETARMWDAETGRELKRLVRRSIFSPAGRYVRFTTFSPNGKRIAVGVENSVLIFDAESGEELRTLERSGISALVHTATFSPDGKKVLSYDGLRIWISDAETGKDLTMLVGHTNSINSATFSSDGKRVLTSSQDSTARIWDTETGSANFGKELKQLGGRLDSVSFAAFSPDGKKVITRSWNDVTIRDAETGEKLKTLRVPANSVSDRHRATFSPDGKKIIAGAWDTVVIWDAETGEELKKLETDTTGFESILLSLDGKKVLALLYDNTARVWDAESGEELKKLEGPKELETHGSSMHIAFSPDSKKVVMVGNNVKIARIWTLE